MLLSFFLRIVAILGFVAWTFPLHAAAPLTQEVLVDFDRTFPLSFEPRGDLALGSDGKYYGVTWGGYADRGSVYQLELDGTVKLLVAFTGESGDAPGAAPNGGLVEGGDHAFYGTTQRGGTGGAGTIFKVTSSGEFAQLVDLGLQGEGGGTPLFGLTLATDGYLYGTTQDLSRRSGTHIFRLSQDGRFESIATLEANRMSRMVQLTDGHLYVAIGSELFRLTPPGTVESVAQLTHGGRRFGGPLGLCDGGNGRLYVNGKSWVFRITPGGKPPALLATLEDDYFGAGYRLSSGLVKMLDGNFYATFENFQGGGVVQMTPKGVLTKVAITYPDYGDHSAPTVASDGSLLVHSDYELRRLRFAPAPRVVAMVGSPVPDQPVGTTYASLGVPGQGTTLCSLHENGRITPAIMGADGRVRVKVGDLVQKAEGGTSWKLAKLKAPSGDAAVATLKIGSRGISAENDKVLLAGLRNGPVRVAAYESQQLDDLPGVTLKRIGTIDGTGETIFFLATLQGSAVTEQNDTALCAALAEGQVRVLVREGQIVDGRTVRIIGSLVGVKSTLAHGRWNLLSQNAIGVRLSFSDQTRAYYTIPDRSALSTASPPTVEDWKLWWETGDALPTGVEPAEYVDKLGMPSFSSEGGEHGTMVFKTTSTSGNQMLVRSGEASEILARRGDTIVTVGRPPWYEPSTFDGPILSVGASLVGSRGRVVFTANHSGPPKFSLPHPVLWMVEPSGEFRMLARIFPDRYAQNAAPGAGSWGSLISFAMPQSGPRGPIILGTLSLAPSPNSFLHTNSSSYNNLCLWAMNSQGTLQLMMRTGDDLVIEGKRRVVTTITALAPTTGSIGAAQGFDDEGHIYVSATFSDGAKALLELTVP